ncbi:MAG: ABC transporter permease [Clostridia bacterium]|nr:ABC transporter permease [Clostridia bacterium]
MLEKVWMLLKADRHSISIINEDLAKRTASKFKMLNYNSITIIIMSILVILIGLSVNMIAEELAKKGATFIVLAIMGATTVLLMLMNTIYKSQGMLFDSKDNNMLLSMPIEKKVILAERIIKLMLTQYIWGALFIIPATVVYIKYEGLSVGILITTLVMLFFMPILPIVVGTILGYIVKIISSRFKNKNLIQIITSIIIFILFYVVFGKISEYIQNVTTMDTEIFEFLKKLYYPIGLYAECVYKVDYIKLLQIIIINIIPFILFILFFSIEYFNIISKLSENHAKSNYVIKDVTCKSLFMTLLTKEAKRYFRSSIYLLNTITGPVMLLIASIFIAFKGLDMNTLKNVEGMTDEMLSGLIAYIPMFIFLLVTFTVSMTNISASSISYEGKNIFTLKALPIKVKDIFNVKILFHCLIVLIPTIFAIVISSFVLKQSILSTLIMIVAAICQTVFFAIVGLVINLYMPKISTDDVSVVKQSASSFLSIIIGILVAVGIMVASLRIKVSSPFIFIGGVSAIFVVLSTILYSHLKLVGEEKFRKIN